MNRTNIKLPIIMNFSEYPICTMPLVESYLKYKKIFNDTAFVFLDYSLKYEKFGDEISIDKNSELNLSLTIGGKSIGKTDFDNNDKYMTALREIYGVTVGSVDNHAIKLFKDYIVKQLMLEEPVIFQFDLFYIADRMHYRKRYYDHMIAIIGYDEQNKCYHCIDGSSNPYFVLTETDFEEGFEYVLRKYGSVRSYYIEYNNRIIVPDLKYLKSRLEKILEYNNQGDKFGLNALCSFSRDIKEFLHLNTSGKSFDIADSYKIYKERKTSIRSLQKFEELYPEYNKELRDVVSAMQLEERLWFEFFFITKRSLLDEKWIYEKQWLFIIDKLQGAMKKTIQKIEDLNIRLKE